MMLAFILGLTVGVLVSIGVMMYLSKGLMMTVKQIQNKIETYTALANKVLREVEAANDRSKDCYSLYLIYEAKAESYADVLGIKDYKVRW